MSPTRTETSSSTESVDDNSTLSPTVVVVDPWSTGNRLCQLIVDKGYTLVVVFPHDNIRSLKLPTKHMLLSHETDEELAPMKYQSLVEELKGLRQSHNLDIISVIAGSETGVLLAEKLANTLNLPTNPPRLTQARRDKYLMGETLRAAGVRSVYQLLSRDWNQTEAFVKEWNPTPFKVVVKPNMGAGSDDVYLCESMEDLKEKFEKINCHVNSLGAVNDGALVQEYLDGEEYVVDTVSRNGVHRIASLWKYDKRRVNGRFNVYFGSIPLLMDNDVSRQLSEYIVQVLDALEFTDGPGHAEVKMTSNGPCLVEIGARCHGGGGVWVDIANETWGLNQLDMLVDSFRGFSGDFKFPEKVHNRFGVVLDMVAYENLQVVGVPGAELVLGLKSFYKVEWLKKVGDKLQITLDCNTTPGSVMLIHESREQVMEDFNYLHELQKTPDAFFKLKR